MIKKQRIGIISYCDKVRTYANVNHQYYASKHGYTYIYDIAPTTHGVFKNKVEKILKYLDLFDWVFWIDDDAFFMQYNKPLSEFIGRHSRHDLIFCKSPLNEGKWTYLSSGNFFIKNNKKTKEFLRSILDTDLEVAAKSWDEDKYGLYTRGDQDIMVHLLHNDSRFNGNKFHTTLEYDQFNSRPFHFKNKADDQFLVHFTGEEKNRQALDFAKNFQLSPALIPVSDFEGRQGIYPLS